MKKQELQQILKMLQEQGYISDNTIAMSILFAMKLENHYWLKALLV